MVKIDFEYRLGGRRVSADQWVKGIAEERKTAEIKKLRQKVESVRCPTHHSGPRLNSQVPSGDNVHFTYASCCDELKKKVEQLLK